MRCVALRKCNVPIFGYKPMIMHCNLSQEGKQVGEFFATRRSHTNYCRIIYCKMIRMYYIFLILSK